MQSKRITLSSGAPCTGAVAFYEYETNVKCKYERCSNSKIQRISLFRHLSVSGPVCAFIDPAFTIQWVLCPFLSRKQYGEQILSAWLDGWLVNVQHTIRDVSWMRCSVTVTCKIVNLVLWWKTEMKTIHKIENTAWFADAFTHLSLRVCLLFCFFLYKNPFGLVKEVSCIELKERKKKTS